MLDARSFFLLVFGFGGFETKTFKTHTHTHTRLHTTVWFCRFLGFGSFEIKKLKNHKTNNSNTVFGFATIPKLKNMISLFCFCFAVRFFLFCGPHQKTKKLNTNMFDFGFSVFVLRDLCFRFLFFWFCEKHKNQESGKKQALPLAAIAAHM